MRRPLLNITEFTKQHEDQLQMMQKYMTTKRGRRAVDDITAENFKYPAALSLKAMSSLARIAVAKAAENVFNDHLDMIQGAEFLTLCPREFAVSMPEAPAFQPVELIKWACEIMGECNHVSVVDLAYYSNFSVKAGTMGTAHFHVHAIRWSINAEPLDPARAAIANSDMPALIPSLKACHVLPLSHRMLIQRAIYMSKMPLSEYRVFRLKVEKSDPLTGEIFAVLTDQHRQRSRPLGPGDVAKIMRALGDRDIPSLAFAGDTGVAMLDTIFRGARGYVERQSPSIKP